MSQFLIDRRIALLGALGALIATEVTPGFAESSAGDGRRRSVAESAGGAGTRATRLIAAQMKLGAALVRLLSKTRHENIVVSPASLAAVLSFVDLGANEQMRRAICRTLGFGGPSSQVPETLDQLRSALAVLDKPKEGGPLRTANLFVLDPASRPFKLAILGLRSAGVEVWVDDLSRIHTIRRINEFVRDQTEGLIPAILDEPSDDAGLVAVNAIHFKDRWKLSFDPTETRVQPFHASRKITLEIPLMRLPAGEYMFRQDDHFVAVELPYQSDDFRLVIATTKTSVAPPAAFSRVTSWLSGDGFSVTSGEVSIPRISLSETIELLEALDLLGLKTARRQGDALGGFSESDQIITRVIQKIALSVDEKGTEASVATAVGTSRSASTSGYISMIVDRPFVFSLRDQKTGLSIMQGYVARPMAAK